MERGYSKSFTVTRKMMGFHRTPFWCRFYLAQKESLKLREEISSLVEGVVFVLRFQAAQCRG